MTAPTDRALLRATAFLVGAMPDDQPPEGLENRLAEALRLCNQGAPATADRDTLAAHLAEVFRFCRVCGCSEDDACETEAGPCWWSEADLCSACAGGALFAEACWYCSTDAVLRLDVRELGGDGFDVEIAACARHAQRAIDRTRRQAERVAYRRAGEQAVPA